MASHRIAESYLQTFTQCYRPCSPPETATKGKKHLIGLITGNCSLKQSRISRPPKEKHPGGISITKNISNALAAAKRGKLDGPANTEGKRGLNRRYNGTSVMLTNLGYAPLEGWQHDSASQVS